MEAKTATEPKRRKRKRTKSKPTPIVAKNGCTCTDCLPCDIARVVKLGETHRKGGRGMQHWNRMERVNAYADGIAARFGGTREEVIEMISLGRTEEDMELLWQRVPGEEDAAIHVPRAPATKEQIAAVERARAAAARPARRPLLATVSVQTVADALGVHRVTVARRLRTLGRHVPRGHLPLAVVAATWPEAVPRLRNAHR